MAKRTDHNQSEIVQALRAAGATVESLHEVGRGVPDLMVGFRGDTFLFEVKGPRGRLNALQVAWHGQWAGQVCVVRSAEEALRVVGAVEA